MGVIWDIWDGHVFNEGISTGVEFGVESVIVDLV
jgi:hypothetical protein